MSDCDDATRLKPDFWAVYTARADAPKAKGDLQGALGDCDEAIRLEPESNIAYLCRASVRKAKGDLDGVLRDIDELIRLGPDSSLDYFSRARLRKAKGDLDGAELGKIAADDRAVFLVQPLLGDGAGRGSNRSIKENGYV